MRDQLISHNNQAAGKTGNKNSVLQNMATIIASNFTRER